MNATYKDNQSQFLEEYLSEFSNSTSFTQKLKGFLAKLFSKFSKAQNDEAPFAISEYVTQAFRDKEIAKMRNEILISARFSGRIL